MWAALTLPTVIQKDGRIEYHKHLTYIKGIKAVLYTMGMGAFKVGKEGRQSFFAPLDPRLRHRAQAESCMLRHSHPRDARDKGSDAENNPARAASRTTVPLINLQCRPSRTLAKAETREQREASSLPFNPSERRTRPAVHRGQQKICKFLNDPRSGTNRNCADAHVCDIMLETGKACDLTNHNRVRHRGMRVPP